MSSRLRGSWASISQARRPLSSPRRSTAVFLARRGHQPQPAGKAIEPRGQHRDDVEALRVSQGLVEGVDQQVARRHSAGACSDSSGARIAPSNALTGSLPKLSSMAGSPRRPAVFGRACWRSWPPGCARTGRDGAFRASWPGSNDTRAPGRRGCGAPARRRSPTCPCRGRR